MHIIDAVCALGDEMHKPNPDFEVYRELLDTCGNPENEILITTAPDDICRKCGGISRDGICLRPAIGISRGDVKFSKYNYNKSVDTLLMIKMDIEDNSRIEIGDFLRQLKRQAAQINQLYTHYPAQDPDTKYESLMRGLERLEVE